jgi:hypothetical protein
METTGAVVLPYRTDAVELARWLEAGSRGRTPAKIRSLDFGAKAYEGTLGGAQALGFVEPGRTELTESGRAYVLAAPEARVGLLRAAMLAYEPYGLLLEAVFARGAVESTETAWIESWWAEHGYGASATNRAEGAVAFARLADAAGLGSYVQGRRGHPSRIAWSQPREAAVSAQAWGDLWSAASAAPAPSPAARSTPATLPAGREAAEEGGSAVAAHNRAGIERGAGRVAQLRVPAALSAAERERLRELFELLLGTPSP